MIRRERVTRELLDRIFANKDKLEYKHILLNEIRNECIRTGANNTDLLVGLTGSLYSAIVREIKEGQFKGIGNPQTDQRKLLEIKNEYANKTRELVREKAELEKKVINLEIALEEFKKNRNVTDRELTIARRERGKNTAYRADVTVERILELDRLGYTQARIAEELDVSVDTIRRRLRSAGY